MQPLPSARDRFPRLPPQRPAGWQIRGGAPGAAPGHEWRGPLLPPTVPGWRSRSERFDMAVLEAYEPIERRWQDRVSELDVAVDEIPRISAKDPESVQWPPEVIADGRSRLPG
ncbi:hypothetical protein BZL29_0419 [Mycobacterium kansasii]|uniref:Uncharacterized protein n=1 Tax=Mycobacterium kansasii TaxID=1768 RepID=A0A1V3XX38_MYCKA|nr:hypothetical protein BZL29_0419 [Mycobacterium kansasii]